MKTLVSRFTFFLAASLLAAAAHAQVFRAYLASYGNDSNPCTVSAPCRLLPAALTAVSSAGEIWMLDSANFNLGTVAINKSVNIRAVPGVVGSIVAVNNTAAIVIGNGIDVSLRNVAIVNNASSPGTDGIQMQTGNVSVEDSVIAGLPFSGVVVNGGGNFSIHNSVVRDTATGIFAKGGAIVDVTNTKFYNCPSVCVYSEASVASTTTSVDIRNSVFSNYYVGAEAFGSLAGSTAKLMVTGSSFSGGAYGVTSEASLGTTVVTVGTTSAYANTAIGFSQFYAGATFETFGNNTVRGNATNTQGAFTTVGGS